MGLVGNVIIRKKQDWQVDTDTDPDPDAKRPETRCPEATKWNPGDVHAAPGLPISSRVKRTGDTEDVLAGHVGIDHGGLQTGVAEQFLNRPDVMPPFKKMRRKAVPERMNRGGADYPRRAHSLLKTALQAGDMDVMATVYPRSGVNGVGMGREYPEPAPFFSRIRIFSFQGIRQADPFRTVLPVMLKQLPCPQDLPLQIVF